MLLKMQYQRLKKKQNKLTCESNPSEKSEQNVINKIKPKKYFTLKT